MADTPYVQNGKKPDIDTTLALMATIGDTTWRMFVPSVGFTLLGVWLDSVFAMKPWLMIVGIIVGAAGAFLLVKRQVVAASGRTSSDKGATK